MLLTGEPLRFSRDRRGRPAALRPPAVRAHEGARGARARRARASTTGPPVRVTYRLTRHGPRARAGASTSCTLGAALARRRARRDARPSRSSARVRPTRGLAAAPTWPAGRSARRNRSSRVAGCQTPQPATADDVKAICEERSIRFIRFWFTDILGQLKSFSDRLATSSTTRFEGGMGFDGSSITGFNAIEESDMIAMPDPSTFAVLPWRPEEQGVGRMFCDVLTPERTPYEGDPRHVLRRALERAKSMGFDTFNVGPELEYFLFKDKNGDRGPRRGRLLRPDDARRRLRRAPRDGARARAARHPRRVQPPRGRPEPARGRHALRRRAEDGRRLHDLPHHGQGIRDEVRLARDVHAQAAVRRERLRACTRTCRSSTDGAQRLLRRRRPVLPERRRQGVHRRPAAPRARDELDLRPVGQQLQAPRARLRGAGLRRLVAAQPLGARARAALPPGQGAGDADGAALPGPRVQPVPDVRDAAARRPRGHREGLRAARADGARTSTTWRPTSAGGWGSSSCPRRSARRSS